MRSEHERAKNYHRKYHHRAGRNAVVGVGYVSCDGRHHRPSLDEAVDTLTRGQILINDEDRALV